MQLIDSTEDTHTGRKRRAEDPDITSSDEQFSKMQSPPGQFTGLFKQYMLAEPSVPKDKTFRFPTPPGYEPLNIGKYGSVFVSLDRSRVLKCFDSDQSALQEWQVVKHVVQVAPEYTAGPAFFYKETLPTKAYYCIGLSNTGPTMWTRVREMSLLNMMEASLGLLQAIHFTLLLGTSVDVNDLHEGNVCVRGQDEHFEMRWIDFGEWKIFEDHEKRAKRDALKENGRALLNDDSWLGRLCEDEDESKVDAMFNLLIYFPSNFVERMDLRNLVGYFARSLVWLAKEVETQLMPSSRNAVCTARVAKLLADIEASASVLQA